MPGSARQQGVGKAPVLDGLNQARPRHLQKKMMRPPRALLAAAALPARVRPPRPPVVGGLGSTFNGKPPGIRYIGGKKSELTDMAISVCSLPLSV